MRQLLSLFTQSEEEDIVSAYRHERDEQSQSRLGALAMPAHRLIHATLFQNPDTRQTAIAFASTCGRTHKHIRDQPPMLTDLLSYMARRNKKTNEEDSEDVETILQKHPELVFERGNIIDDVGREHIGISPLEYAVSIRESWQHDNKWEIADMIAEYIEPGIEKLKRLAHTDEQQARLTTALQIRDEYIVSAYYHGRDDQSQSFLGALPWPALRLIHATLFQNPDTRQTAIALASTCGHFHQLMRCQPPMLTNLLSYIARGNKKKNAEDKEDAQTILQKHPELLFARGYIVDDVGRQYIGISPLEYAVWVGDSWTQPDQWELVDMIAKYIEPGIKKLRSQGIFTNNQTEQLTTALQIKNEYETIREAIRTQDPALTQVLTDVAYGNQIEVEAILAQTPQLLFEKGYVKDHAGRLFHVSPFQLALWCGDFKMWGQLPAPGEAAAEEQLQGMRRYFARIENGFGQAKEQFEWLTTHGYGCRYHGTHFDYRVGELADKAFIKAVELAEENNEWDLDHLDHLKYARGKTQRLESTCHLQWRVNFDTPWDWANPLDVINIPDFQALVRPPSCATYGEGLFPLGSLGVDFSYTNGLVQPYGWGLGMTAVGRRRALREGVPKRQLDLHRTERLCEVTNTQIQALSDYLDKQLQPRRGLRR